MTNRFSKRKLQSQAHLTASAQSRDRSPAKPPILPESQPPELQPPEPQPPEPKAPRYFWSRLLGTVFMTASVVGLSVLAVGAVRVGYQLVVNPSAVTWLEDVLPMWGDVPDFASEAVTWAEVTAEIEQSTFSLGTPINLSDLAKASEDEPIDLLVPLLKTRPGCQQNCTQIAELRVYRSLDGSTTAQPAPEEKFLVLDRVTITGPEEFFVLAPRNESRNESSGSDRRLPLTEVRSLQNNAPSQGVWLTLQGEYSRGGDPILYGRIAYYEPQQSRLVVMLPWTSPARQQPQWQELTQAEPPELVVNQTVDLEPNLKAYRLVDSRSALVDYDFEPIALTTPALSQPDYQNALTLANAGLWSSALSILQPLVKSKVDPDWPEAAEAQFRLIEAHAKLTQNQADRAWSSPSQQLLAYLIDGQWEPALKLFEEAQSSQREMEGLLKADSGRLWERVSAALRVNPNRLEVRTWGALLLAIQDTPTAAFDWLQRQPNPSKATEAKVRRLLHTLPAFTVAEAALNEAASPSSTPTSTSELRGGPSISRILGSVAQVQTINPTDWIQPDANQPLTLQGQQVWYQIEVAQFHDGQRWQKAPFSNLNGAVNQAAQLWRSVGLSVDNQMQISTWATAESSVWVTVKAAQVRGGTLRLLATGEAINPVDALPPIATTAAALQWVSLPATQPLALVHQEQPSRVKALIPGLWQELRQTQHVVNLPADGVQAALQQMRVWPIQQLDVTGDGQPEAILTITPDRIGELLYATAQSSRPGIAHPRTLIFSSNGKLLYSDLGQPQQSVAAIATLSGASTYGLVIHQDQKYRVLSWSSQQQRFE